MTPWDARRPEALTHAAQADERGTLVLLGGGSRAIPRAMERPQLSIVIPLFNEEDNVRMLLDELFEQLGKLGRTHEVICVDDGSRDGTFAALQAAAAARPDPTV